MVKHRPLPTPDFTQSASQGEAAEATPRHALNGTGPYESDLVCDFFRQVGQLEVLRAIRKQFADARRGVHGAMERYMASMDPAVPVSGGAFPPMLGNAQNPLDHLVGDVVAGTLAGRYVIIEFKRARSGFAEEVGFDTRKPDRAALYDHLSEGGDCERLSLEGHYGAYWDADEIILGNYFKLAGGTHHLGWSVPAFFEYLQDPSFGLSSEGLMAYLQCMTSHGVDLPTDDGLTVFGYIDTSGKFVAMIRSNQIFSMIERAFNQAHKKLRQPSPFARPSSTQKVSDRNRPA